MIATIVLTLIVSLALAALFMILFLHDRKHRGLRSLEQDALMPLQDDDTDTDSRK